MPLSVVLNCHDSGDVLERSLGSVLAQDPQPAEVVVADDGSAEHPSALVERWFPGSAVRVVTQPNAGLSAARNLGLHHVSGDFVVFLDDDDELLPGAVEAFEQLADDGVGIVSGSVSVVPVDEPSATTLRRPGDLGPEMHHEVANYLAGSFAISRELLVELGGFDEGMRCNHQRELFLRAVPECRARGLRIVHTDRPVMRMYRRAAQDRPRNDPARLQGCLERMLERHHDQLARNPAELASVQSNAAVAAIRNGDLASARRLLRGAVRTRPSQAANWGRLAASYVPPVARRIW